MKNITKGECPRLPENFVKCIVKKHYVSLQAYGYWLCKTLSINPEPIVSIALNSVFIKAYEKFDVVFEGYEEKGVGYLAIILRNEIYEDLRKRGRRRTDSLDHLFEQMEPAANAGQPLSYPLQRELLLRDLAEILNAEEFAILSLRIQNYSYEEISTLLCMPRNTVGTKLMKIRKKVTRWLDSLED